MSETYPLDLVVLVPGKDDSEALRGLLSRRHKSLGLRPVRHQVLVHPRRDPGCFHEAPEILATFQRTCRHALVIFDHEGCGREGTPARDLEADLRRRLGVSGWSDRAETLVIEPELEVWIWTPSTHVDAVLGWRSRQPALRDWLATRGLWPESLPKPPRPKAALHAALREAQVNPSSSIFRKLAEKVSLEGCTDPAFSRLRALLAVWFPGEGS